MATGEEQGFRKRVREICTGKCTASCYWWMVFGSAARIGIVQNYLFEKKVDMNSSNFCNRKFSASKTKKALQCYQIFGFNIRKLTSNASQNSPDLSMGRVTKTNRSNVFRE